MRVVLVGYTIIERYLRHDDFRLFFRTRLRADVEWLTQQEAAPARGPGLEQSADHSTVRAGATRRVARSSEEEEEITRRYYRSCSVS